MEIQDPVGFLGRHDTRCGLSVCPRLLPILSVFTPKRKSTVEIGVEKASTIRIAGLALRQKVPQARFIEGSELLPRESTSKHGALHRAGIVIERAPST